MSAIAYSIIPSFLLTYAPALRVARQKSLFRTGPPVVCLLFVACLHEQRTQLLPPSDFQHLHRASFFFLPFLFSMADSAPTDEVDREGESYRSVGFSRGAPRGVSFRFRVALVVPAGSSHIALLQPSSPSAASTQVYWPRC